MVALASKVLMLVPLFTSNKLKHILYLENFPIENAGYQYRAYKWKKKLEEKGYFVTIKTIDSSKKAFDNHLKTNLDFFLIKSMWKRLFQIIGSIRYERVVVRRELLLYNDYGNLFLEKFLLKLHPNAVLDFDDDIAFAKQEPRKITNLYGRMLFENGAKFTETIQLYQHFFVGSNYLKNYVLKRNNKVDEKNILVLPTCVDYDKYEPKVYKNDKDIITFGWIGGNHNLFLLDNIIEPLNAISKQFSIELLVISGRKYSNKKATFNIKNKQWSMVTQIDDLKKIDIGLMPLLDTNRDKGKAGFKLIQYMGLGIVSIASAVTVNKDIVDDNVNSFLVYNNEWEPVFKKVLKKQAMFSEIGKQARKQIINHYSFNGNICNVENLLCANS